MKKMLKLAKRHPRKAMRLGAHVVGTTFKEFDLNKEEMKELESAGGKAWFKEQKKEVKKPVKKEDKK